MLGWLQDRSGHRGEYRRAPEFEPRTVQPVASRYTHYAVPTHLNSYVSAQYFRVYLNVIPHVPVLCCDIARRISQFYVICLRHVHAVRFALRDHANSRRTPSTLATFSNGVELCVKSGTMIHSLDALFTLETIHINNGKLVNESQVLALFSECR
jgi:hypothetical protein